MKIGLSGKKLYKLILFVRTIMHVFDEVLCSLWSPDIQKMYSMLFMPEVIILNKIKFATSFLSVLN
jgi:hypothetical protein